MLNSNNFDWSYVISGITLVVAIVSPVLVTILNNYHNSKIRKLELDYQKSTFLLSETRIRIQFLFGVSF